MVQSITPHRSWFQFSLRSLLVIVTILALWLGYYGNWARQRRAGRQWLDAHLPREISIDCLIPPQPKLPWPLRLLGEPVEDYHLIVPLRGESIDSPDFQRRIAEIRSLFPECYFEIQPAQNLRQSEPK